MNPPAISPNDLAAELRGNPSPVILDVRLADDFAAVRIPDALNNPVFEVEFGSRLPDLLPDPSRPVRICGAAAGSHEARMAVEKLERASYRDVREIEGGIAAWREAGFPILEGDPLAAEPRAPDGEHAVDLEHSRVEWLGRNLINHHSGTVPLKSGVLRFREGRLTAGELVLDLTRLECADLAGSPAHDILIRHLQDHDFFDTLRHPEARLEITAADLLPDATPGAPNLRLHARLNLRGESRSLEFDAVSGLTPEGKAAAQATFAIDRTRWGVLYGSGKYFHRLAGHLVNDLIEFRVRILTH